MRYPTFQRIFGLAGISHGGWNVRPKAVLRDLQPPTVSQSEAALLGRASLGWFGVPRGTGRVARNQQSNQSP
jgi:hypothetical protein